MKFSKNPTTFFCALLAGLCLPLFVSAQGHVQKELVRLIALHGPSVEEMLESLPEVQEHMNGSSSALTAVQTMLRKQPDPKQKAFLARLEEGLNTRKFLLAEAKNHPDGVYQLLAAIPELGTVAKQALQESGMPPASTRSAYDATSNMSTFQASHMLTCVALHLTDAPGPQKQQLKERIKQEAAKQR